MRSDCFSSWDLVSGMYLFYKEVNLSYISSLEGPEKKNAQDTAECVKVLIRCNQPLGFISEKQIEMHFITFFHCLLYQNHRSCHDCFRIVEIELLMLFL